ncbi:hypothetical protein P3T76_004122 [Phytophthora citrophthora]|uniref:Uncharacterized protein n=1 Tax=Phytophthora citrophthora TaxID=4793 RepID=A0AAD9LP08_9STRA|nr:hypothetical protein P3T76_004122 [Phytophthora citrophthora]
MTLLQQSAVRTLAKIDSSRTDVVKDIVGELERRAIGAGTVTYDGLNDMIMRCHDSADVTSIVNHLQVADQPVPPTTTSEQQSDLQQWSNHFNSIPSSYSIPECTVYQAWMLWQCGSPSTNIPPLWLVEPSQLANKKAKKRLSDFAFLNKAIERQAAD